MRARTTLALLTGMTLALCRPALSQSPGERLSASQSYTIKRSSKGLSANVKVRLDRTFLAEWAIADKNLHIGEYADAKVGKVTAWCRGKKLDKDRIHKFQPVYDDWFFNEVRNWWIDFPSDLKPNDHIAVEYEIEYPDINTVPVIWIPNVDFIENFQLQFFHPQDLRIDFDFFFPYDRFPYEIGHPDEKTTTLTIASVTGAPKLPFFEFNEKRAGILIRIHDGSQLVNPVSVEGLAAWYRPLLAGVVRTFPNVDSSFLDSLEAAPTARDKAKLIYDQVVRNLRYVEEAKRAHWFVPTPPSQVWLNKYGDCKDRAFLAKTLADRAGIDVRLVKCPAQPGLGFEGIHQSLINHLFCALIDGGDTLFFDPTARTTPFGLLPESDVGKNVLVVDSVDARYAFVKSPSSEPTVDLALTGAIDSLARTRATIVLKGYEYDLTLEAMKALTPGVFARVLDSLLSARLYKIDLDSLEVTAQTYDSLVVEGVADLTKFVVVSPKRCYLPKVPFTVIDARLQTRRDDTLALFFDTRDALRIRIDLATSGAAVTADSLSLGSAETAQFSAVAGMGDESHIRLSYEFNRQAKIISGRTKTAFLQFCSDFLDAKKNMFVLEGRQP